MLFNSVQFAIFLPVVFVLYWYVFDYALKHCRYQLRLQNAFIVVASYIFYGWWNWRFLLLIAFTSLCSWASGLLIRHSQPPHRQSRCFSAKFWMVTNIVLNLGILAVFKYYDFFVSEFCRLFNIEQEGLLLKVILPVGISFYTFQALSYSIDVYRQKITPTKDIIAFFAFICFFPQLVAGPIERATNLLPQFLQKRQFSYDRAADGMRQILWGLFKKMVIADNCATYVNQVWATFDTQTGSTLLLAAILFTFQIYGDFSGYSDIAIGTAKLFGIKLMRNFNNPYFSRDIAEFWRRWHISLTTWFRDYVYIPLGGSRPDIPEHIKNRDSYKKLIIVRNTFVIFLLSGFWHGANWTFIAWGTYHALLFLPLILLSKNRRYTGQVGIDTSSDGVEHKRWLPSWHEGGLMLLTFALVVIGWVIFRADSIASAYRFIIGMTDWSGAFYAGNEVWKTVILCVVMLVIEWLQRDKNHALQFDSMGLFAKFVICLLVVEAILFFLPDTPSPFIYFQF